VSNDIDPIIEEFRHLEEEFNIVEAPIIEVEPEKAIIEVTPNEIMEVAECEERSYSDELTDKRREDYDYARNNIKMAIEQGADALEDLLAIAKSSESPRSFEVLSNLMKSIVESNEKLIDINKKVDESETEAGIQVVEKEQVQNQQNNYFIGSTAELQEMIKRQQTKIIEGVVDKTEEE
jgi:hypothetical protein